MKSNINYIRMYAVNLKDKNSKYIKKKVDN
jgi:hypothetical protein